MILFIGDVARGDRDREGFQEIDFPGLLRPDRQMGGADRGCAADPRICRARLARSDRRPARARWCSRCPRTCSATRSRRSTVRAVAAARRSARSWRDPGAVRTVEGSQRARRDRRRRRLEPARRRTISPISPSAHGIPVAAAFRRQDAIANGCGVYAGQLGYGPNPKLLQRIRDADLILAVGARLGESTTDGYTLITPDHPGQTLVHVHPDPNELGRVYHADLPICADMGEFAEMLDDWDDPELVRFSAGEEAHAEWLDWSEPKPRDGVALDLGPCVAAMRDELPANAIICNGAGNFSGWWHRYWRYGAQPSQLAPTSGTMGYGLPAAVAAALRFKDRPVVCVAGDGDFLMNGQELATAAQHGADLLVILVDNGSYGTIRMHQERDYPERISATAPRQPRLRRAGASVRRLGRAVERTEEFAPALDRAMERKGIRLLHCVTDVEQITNATTLTALRERTKRWPS